MYRERVDEQMGKLWHAVERVLFGATAGEHAEVVARLADQRAGARLAALVDDLEAHCDEDVREEQALANLASLRDVPDAELPDGPARTALVWLMSRGGSIYCYASVGPTWYVWIDPLATARFGGYGRVPLAVWRAHYEELLAEMGLAVPAELVEGPADGRVIA